MNSKLIKQSAKDTAFISVDFYSKIKSYNIRDIKQFEYDKLVIIDSQLFEEVYYIVENPDVAQSEFDPIEHFLLYGAQEMRKPASWFNTKYYCEHNNDVLSSGMNPFVHYILYGICEGRLPDTPYSSERERERERERDGGEELFIIPEKADFIVSLGSACRTAHWLRRSQLRLFANPLDWMMRYSLNTVIELFQTGFKNFFSDRFEHVDRIGALHRHIEDTNTKMISMHSFPITKEHDEYYPVFKNIMEKRADRLVSFMNECSSVIFVSNRNEDFLEFKNFIIKIQQMFPFHILYINIRSADYTSTTIQKISSRSEFIEYTFHDVHCNGSDPKVNPDFWLGNTVRWSEVMNSLSLNRRSCHKMQLANIEDRINR